MTLHTLFLGYAHSFIPMRTIYNTESGVDRREATPAAEKLSADPAAQAQAESRIDAVLNQETVTVKGGDSLWKIAKDKLGDPQRWKEIAELNNLEDPNKLKIGQVLKMPKKNADAAAVTASAPVQAAEAALAQGSFAEMLKRSLDTNTLRPAEKVDITLPSDAPKGGFAGGDGGVGVEYAAIPGGSGVEIVQQAPVLPVVEAGHAKAVDVHGNAMA